MGRANLDVIKIRAVYWLPIIAHLLAKDGFTEATVVARTHNDATDRLADNVEELSKRVDRLTDKVIDAAAKLK